MSLSPIPTLRARLASQPKESPTRAAFAEVLGCQDWPSDPAEAIRTDTYEREGLTHERWEVGGVEGTRMPVHLIEPDETDSGPTILAIHGHGYGVKDVAGLWEDGSPRDTPDGYHADFALTLARAGFRVAAPELAGFGERSHRYDLAPESPTPTTCENLAALCHHLGVSVPGLRVREVRTLLDWLESRGHERFGAMGISGGGLVTFFAACMDERLEASVVSGYYSTFKGSVLAMHHCPCNFASGLGRFGEMAHLAELVRPRGLFVESGDHDPIFPIEAVREGLAQAPWIESHLFEGRHRIEGTRSIEWLRRKLF